MIDRTTPTPFAADLYALATEIADGELAPRASDFEERAEFPREVLRTLGKAGLLSLPYPEEFGGGGQPYEVYLQVLEILASRWLCVAESVNVHTLVCHGIAKFGSRQQQEQHLPRLLGGEVLGANCISEAHAGSDAAAMSVRARRDGESYVVSGTKAWVTHAGVADHYVVYCRTGASGVRGISAFLVDADSEGLLPQRPEKKLGVSSSPTAQVVFDDVRVPADRMIGREGRAFLVAMDAMDSGRLAIGACAVGLAQAALDHAVTYAKGREQFGQRIIDFQGLGFLLADLATSVSAARALVLSAARLRDRGKPFGVEAAKAKLFATDMAMRVTTEAVQVLGGYGYTTDHPVERWMREAKLLQIVEGTNQIQRLVISRAL
ncbi:acyl-CoA dehydrogenase family protein [Lentzea sp. NPDC006480]|uniref:acyl-CoA dehydrogenase family protein n=1 Tax=Lentzea sp. NPDC006480 TaxID=3157176 RepID=UPI0033A59C22